MIAVFLASPLKASAEYSFESNQAYARECMRHSLLLDEAPFVPHLLYTQVLDDSSAVERRLGMHAGRIVLRVCRMLVAYCDRGISSGMLDEIELALGDDIPVIFRRLDGKAPPTFGEVTQLIHDNKRK